MMPITSVRLLPGGDILCLNQRGEVADLRGNALIDLAQRAEKQGHNLDGVLCECDGQGVFRLVKQGKAWQVENG